MAHVEYYRIALQRELAKRCAKNPRYSSRAFAQALGIGSGALSQILSGKRVPSLRTAQVILGALELSAEEQRRFMDSLAKRHCSRGLRRISPFFREYKSVRKSLDLSIDAFQVIADWYHTALLELTFVAGFDPDPKWIARQLGISPAEAQVALDRLLRLELLSEEGGRVFKTSAQLNTADRHLTTAALKRHQRQILEKAITSLENDPIETRSMTGMVMAIDPAKLPLAKQMIEEFTQKLCEMLESDARKQVYQLGISLFPVQRSPSEKENSS